jgi:hypothetical protein
MKTVFLKYIFVYLSAFYFLVGGAGYNVVNYCCQTCANEGIEEIATSSCFSIHHHFKNNDSHQVHNDLFCNDLYQHLDNCRFLRLNTDIPSFQATNNTFVKQISTVYLFNLISMFFADKNESIVQNNIPPPNYFLSTSGRILLTYHSILLI